MVVKIKVTKTDTAKKPVKFTLSVPPVMCAKLDDYARQAGASRHALILAILAQVLEDPKFILEVEK